ncbi:MAG: histidinol dehydrogenase [Fimbriimonadaceae bacterium]
MAMRVGSPAEFATWLDSRGADERLYEDAVRPILADVEREGDVALARYAAQFGDPTPRWVSDEEIASAQVSPELEAVLEAAGAHIRAYAERQLPVEWSAEAPYGGAVGQIVRPLDAVGCYVPAGRYPLPSTVLMTAIPAQVAGVQRIVVTCPNPTPEVLAAVRRVPGVRVFRAGGAQAVAALAFGTEALPRVDMIVGPGNAYVAAAKRLVSGRVAIEFSAGPSEVMVVALGAADARWVAADLLAQAEHDPEATAVFVTSDPQFAAIVQAEVERQLADLPTAETARAALNRHGWIVVAGRDAAFDLINAMAPEHLCLYEPELLPWVRHAGSIFLGPCAVEAAGDYATGPNHTLPTGGVARRRGGLSSADFVKLISTQSLGKRALAALAPTVTALARAEGLEAHARSVEVRLG